jgi:hypothetical protein
MAGSADRDDESAVVGITLPLTLATVDLTEDEWTEVVMLLLPRDGVKATVDAAPKDRAANTAPGKNFILLSRMGRF